MDDFLEPNVLHDTYLLKNIEVAVKKIEQAVRENWNITILIDIDSDGVNSGVIIYRQLSKYTKKLKFIHAQRKDGHGLHTVMDKIPDETQLLIIVDSSSNEAPECKKLSEEMGIDVVILDHHEVTTENPYCILVNPHQPGCQYPNKDISGAPLTWKVCRVLDNIFETDYSNELIDLAAIGLIGDMVSLKEPENRTIVHYGLQRINNLGLHTIIKKKNKKLDDLTAKDIAFDITPFINAAARMNKIELVLEMLSSDDAERVLELYKEIEKLNTKRKSTQKDYLARYIDMVNENDKAIVIVDENASKSFAGLVANDLARKFKRPCVVLGKGDGDKVDSYSGSFRSYNSFDMREYLSGIPTSMYSEGHKGAGGVGVKKKDIEYFRQAVNEGLKTVSFESSLTYDLEFDVAEVNEELIRQLRDFYRISGSESSGFEEGRFLIKGLFSVDKKLMGQSKNTVKVDCDKLSLMKFNVDEEYYDDMPVFAAIEAVGNLNVNEWIQYRPKYQVIKTNQLFIEDYRLVQ